MQSCKGYPPLWGQKIYPPQKIFPKNSPPPWKFSKSLPPHGVGCLPTYAFNSQLTLGIRVTRFHAWLANYLSASFCCSREISLLLQHQTLKFISRSMGALWQRLLILLFRPLFSVIRHSSHIAAVGDLLNFQQRVDLVLDVISSWREIVIHLKNAQQCRVRW